jgi:hypothetical protein
MPLNPSKLMIVETGDGKKIEARPEDPIEYDPAGIIVDGPDERVLVPWGNVSCIRQPKGKD